MISAALCRERLGLVREGRSIVQPEAIELGDDGVIPNSRFPVLIYRGSADDAEDAPRELETLFEANDWPPQWRGGVFAFHHYHSTAHEALGVWGGWARIQIGGEVGPIMTVEAGDVAVLPAGTGHCRIEAGAGFGVVGAYPANQPDWDLCRAEASFHDTALARIAQVPLPSSDPVTGTTGPLLEHWRTAPS